MSAPTTRIGSLLLLMESTDPDSVLLSGDALRAMRQKANVPVHTLAAAVGLSPNTIRSREGGMFQPSERGADQMLRAQAAMRWLGAQDEAVAS